MPAGAALAEARVDQGGKVTVESDARRDSTRTAAAPGDDDVALVLHTSGTTSRPKGVPLTHGNLMASIDNIAAHYQLSPTDTGLVVMPQFHGGDKAVTRRRRPPAPRLADGARDRFPGTGHPRGPPAVPGRRAPGTGSVARGPPPARSEGTGGR